MADTDFETVDGMVQLFRDYTGLSATADISDANIIIRLSNFYTGPFGKKVRTDDFSADYTANLLPTDSGEISLPTNIIAVDDPVYLNGGQIVLYRDQELFWGTYPDQDEGYITAPTLTIGISNAAHVKNSSFKYIIGNDTYEKAAAETALSGDTVPQDKYGAWSLSIDADGTISINEADDNATGYSTPALAIDAIPSIGSDEVVMGYVTIIDSDSTFVPGTTELSASGVTDTYTDGDPQFRNEPTGVLVQGRTLYVRPKASDYYTLKIPMLLKRPTALTAGSDEVFNEEWGQCIAIGTSIAHLVRLGNTTKVERLLGGFDVPGTYRFYIGSITGEMEAQELVRKVQRRF